MKPIRTRTALLRDRKEQQRPHISYDIDGDGQVNPRDYVLAKHFDKDGDGRLNTAERQAAMKALEQGFEDRFVWGLEQSAGLKDHIRIMQKRGKIVHGENFTVLTETYPVHPLANEPRRHEDRRDMLRKRKEALVNEMEEEKKLWDQLNPYFIDRKWFKPPGYTENPPHNSVS